MVGFKTDDDIKSVSKHVESCLDMNNFELDGESLDGSFKSITWNSKDGKYFVVLHYSKRWQIKDANAPIGISYFSGYTLTVMEKLKK